METREVGSWLREVELSREAHEGRSVEVLLSERALAPRSLLCKHEAPGESQEAIAHGAAPSHAPPAFRGLAY